MASASEWFRSSSDALSRYLFRKKAPSYMFDWVLNTPLRPLSRDVLRRRCSAKPMENFPGGVCL